MGPLNKYLIIYQLNLTNKQTTCNLPFTLTAFISMTRGLWIIRHELKRSSLDGANRNKIKYLYLGLVLYFFCTLDFLQVYGVSWYPIGTLFFIASFFVIGYAISRYQLIDIQVVIRRTLFYSTLVVLISLVYIAFVMIIYSSVVTKEKTASALLNFVSVLLIALTFKPIEMALHRVLDRKFFKGSISEIAEQKERLESELERSERLKAVGVMAAGLAHEIKNPVTALKTFAEYLPERYDEPGFRETLARVMKNESERIETLVRNLLDFSRPAEPVKVVCDINKMILGLMDLMSAEFSKAKVSLVLHLDEHVKCLADIEQLRQALLNLVLNAIESMRPVGGNLTISSLDGTNDIKIIIQDEGCGIPRHKIPHIFDPFYSDKPGGTGLGLALTYSIINRHEGKIDVQSQGGKGTSFVLSFPTIAS